MTIAQQKQHLRIHGRVPFNENGRAQLWWSFSGFSFCFDGTGFSFSASFSDEQPGIVSVVIDGITHKRAVDGDNTFSFAMKEGAHVVTIRRTSKRTDSLAINICDLSVDGTFLEPPAEKQMKIEFFGDSITCGYGVLGLPSHHCWLTHQEDTAYSYAALTAAHFDAEARLISISGHGVVHNFGKDRRMLIPKAFRWSGSEPDTAEWDFADGFMPDVVVINAGTNDVAGGTTADEMQEGATAFIQNIRAQYPDAKIVWTYGMMNTDFIPPIDAAVKQLRETDKNVWFLPTTPIWKYEGQSAANGHPGVVGQRRLAKELISLLEKIL